MIVIPIAQNSSASRPSGRPAVAPEPRAHCEMRSSMAGSLPPWLWWQASAVTFREKASVVSTATLALA